MKKRRFIFIILIAMGLAVALLVIFANTERSSVVKTKFLSIYTKAAKESSESLRRCVLQQEDPYDLTLKPHIDLQYHRKERDSCNRKFKVISSFKDGQVYVNDKTMNCWARCFYVGEIYHGENVEDKWTSVKKTVYKCSFVEVKCSRTNKITSVDYTMLHYDFIPVVNSVFHQNKQSGKGKQRNIFVFLIDSVSTGAAERYLQRTLRFMEKSFKAVQFPYLNRVGLNSRPNALALFYGKSVEPIDRAVIGLQTEPSDWEWYEACNRYLDNETTIFDDFKELGYKTLLTDDYYKPIFNYPNCKGLNRSIVDHTMDPFIMQSYKESQRKNFNGDNCHYIHQDTLEYTKRFIQAFPDEPLFAWNFMTRVTHNYQSSALILDDDLVHYLFQNKEMFDESFLIFMSDHGGFGGSITETDAGRFELNNPFLTMSVPKSLRTPQILDILKENSEKLQTHYDLRATLLDIAKYQPQNNYKDRDFLELKGEKGQSFLRKQEGERTCLTLPIPFTYCICQYPMEALNPNSTEVVEAGKTVIQVVNKLLNKTGELRKCNLWSFSHVESSSAFAPFIETGSMKIVVAARWPYNKARFATSVHRSSNGMFTVGRIQRIDRYGHRTRCTRGLVEPLCDSIPCNSDWQEFDGACYKKFRDQRRNYAEAEAECKKFDAHLTSITDKNIAFLGNYMPSSDFFYTGLQWSDDLAQYVNPLLNTVANISFCFVERQKGQNCALQYDRCLVYTDCSTIQYPICQKGGWPTTTTTTTTTTKQPTTTTTKPLISDPKRWIIDYNKGTQIHRSSQIGEYLHHYTIDWRNTPSGFRREVGNGFVVSEMRFPQLQATCPHLFKVGVWRYGAMTYIGNYPPGSFTKQESFYCAPSQFYCGANFLLRRLDKQGGGDIFYASNENEANQQLLGNAPGLYSANWFKETPCWIWQDYTDTWYSIVKANGGMIWSGYNAPGIVHFYTLQRHLIPADFQKERAAPPGYVVMQNLYDSYFKTQCPELIPMKIWHGFNGIGQAITWIGREGRSPPAVMKNSWVEELRFYCAPRFSYCNANFLLRRMDKTNGAVTFYYPWSEDNAARQLRGEAPGVFKNSRWSEEACYIWANWL